MSKLEEIGLLSSFDQKLQKTCEDLGLIDPIVLLVGLANGKDLNSHSIMYEWILEHEESNGEEPPSVFEWLELVDLLKNHARFMPVDEKTKLSAQRTLAEYQHNKKKSVEIHDKTQNEGIEKLKPSEVRRFNRIFKNEY